MFETLSRALTNDPYDKGDSEFSITELIAPARARVLRHIHRDEIIEDVSDRLWSLYGQVTHGVLERAAGGALVEKRFFTVVNGVKISAQIDSLCLEDFALRDWKFTSAYGFTKGKGVKTDWVQQLNGQAFILEQNGYTVHSLAVVALLRDWLKSKAKYDKTYPQSPIVEATIEKWDHEETGRFLADRIYAHQQAQVELPECTSEETVKGARCEKFCDVSSFCEQYQKRKQLNNEVFI